MSVGTDRSAVRGQPASEPAVSRVVRRRGLGRLVRRPRSGLAAADEASERVIAPAAAASYGIATDDALGPVLLAARGPVDIADLADLDGTSPALATMRAEGVVLVVPLISAGELAGVLGLGERRSESGYSTRDRALLAGLAEHAAPALRVSRLVQRQRDEARDRERLEGELAVARAIQQQFLPSSPPELAGWQLAALYRPARTVGGDFYDFMSLPDGRLMLVVGDVTDKGVPAALVMASTHALLRAYGPRLVDPGEVLVTVNELLCGDIPERMFVTCLVVVVDPVNGELVFANAGHSLPLVRRGGQSPQGTVELRATGMPLGLMPGSRYDVRTSSLEPGELLLLHSDGLVESHDDARAMFGTPRLAELVGRPLAGPGLIDATIAAWRDFVGVEAPQEDDITLVTVERLVSAPVDRRRHLVADIVVPSLAGQEREVVGRLRDPVTAVGLSDRVVERLATATGEAVMNAIEHGNQGRGDLDVVVKVWHEQPADAAATTGGTVVVEVIDHDLAGPTPALPEEPDIDLKLAGRQRPRGWGLYLMRAMVESLEESRADGRHVVTLTVSLDQERPPAGPAARGA